MFELTRKIVLTLIICLFLQSVAFADFLDEQLIVSESIGTGSNTAYLVIDFEESGGPSYAFEYQFEGSSTVHDMLLAFTNYGLGYSYTDYTSIGWGIFADNFSYGQSTGYSSFYWSHSVGFLDESGVSWSAAEGGVDSEQLVDGLISGWYNNFNDDYSVINPVIPLIPSPGALIFLSFSFASSTFSRRRSSL